jgi:hypothetical protein
VEADLAMSAGVDLRDLRRPGGGPSRLTLRRLLVLVRGLPPDSLTWLLVGEDNEKAEREAKLQKLRERTAYYESQKAG